MMTDKPTAEQIIRDSQPAQPEKPAAYNPTLAYIYARRRQKQRLGLIPRG